MKACIKFGIKDHVIVKEVDINNQANVTEVSFPDTGREDFIKASFILENFHFSSGHIVSYFVNRSVCDGLPVGDFKAINKLMISCMRICLCVGIFRISRFVLMTTTYL